MLRFLASLGFLYVLAIIVLVLYGWVYYRGFARNRSPRKLFPWVFLFISSACLGFLYVNFHAPLRLETFSNLDHHFLRHDGFRVSGNIVLGRADTINFKNNPYNLFSLQQEEDGISVQSSYSEEPFYAGEGGDYEILSRTFPAVEHTVTLDLDTLIAVLGVGADDQYALTINDTRFSAPQDIRTGISAWQLFKDHPSFTGSPWYTHEKLVQSLRELYILRSAGSLRFFISGKLFRYVNRVRHDQSVITGDDLVFHAGLTTRHSFAWGIGFRDNNRNHFRVQPGGQGNFMLLNKYPVAYPLTEENRTASFRGQQPYPVYKFLVADPQDLAQVPAVFTEGFLFDRFGDDALTRFSPVWLNYTKSRGGNPVSPAIRYLDRPGQGQTMVGDSLLLATGAPGVRWLFTIQDTLNWKLGDRVYRPAEWKWLIFGSLFFFVILVFFSALDRPAHQLNWAWQLLSCIIPVLLTTRYFLYWRYKSFPPYEGMDLPSLQQLNSFWNFGIIILVTIMLGFVFGFGFLKNMYNRAGKGLAGMLNRSFRPWNDEMPFPAIQKGSLFSARPAFLKRWDTRLVFFTAWICLLAGAGLFATVKDFHPTTSRHLSVAMALLYFLFVIISYKYSPLVAPAEKSWWSLRTTRTINLLVSNPVKVLLSVSLLAFFIFIDIGFAIVFINFLLFNEAFLCINYTIGGLSAGSRRNATLFGIAGAVYLLLFIVNLAWGPYIFKSLLELPQLLYTASYVLFALVMAVTAARLFFRLGKWKRTLITAGMMVFLFLSAFLFFPKERILDKAAMTKYRIDVMAMPPGKAMEAAYADGKNYTPVIRAAQNQWFINTFIDERNNPRVHSTGFTLLPHAPQNKGARYNAQATDLVTSRFLIAEHGTWSVLLYVLLILVPAVLLASFYKLYPDFTNRINREYPVLTTGFSLLNYLLVTALLVILAATGRYIFLGQDLPFGSILSKQSILFPCILLVMVMLLFRRIPPEQYPDRRKLVPGIIVFAGLAGLLFLFRPAYNRDKVFNVPGISGEMDRYIDAEIQPVLDHFDTAASSANLGQAQKDKLFTDSLREMMASGTFRDASLFLQKELERYTKGTFTHHLNQSAILFLDLHSGRPQLQVNDNYFRVDPPPHLQQYWSGNVYGDTTVYNLAAWDEQEGRVQTRRIGDEAGTYQLPGVTGLAFIVHPAPVEGLYGHAWLKNTSAASLVLSTRDNETVLLPGDSVRTRNPERILVTDTAHKTRRILDIRPDAFMNNYFVNGRRYYVYPMSDRFIWARNFSEGVSSAYNRQEWHKKNAVVSLDAGLTDSLTARIRNMMNSDTSYRTGAEYGICIADGNGRLIAMADYIHGFQRPDPNDKAAFHSVIHGRNGIVSQSLLRKQIGNINLLRMNPGPGSTLKPVVFTAIASQMNLDWDALAADGFSGKKEFFGGEKVPGYDFEKNNGHVGSVRDYLRLSDNYYHANLLLLGSYDRQAPQDLLTKYFSMKNPEAGHWPRLQYKGKDYWLDGFTNWPGYADGKANFGSDSSFVSVGLLYNFGILTGNEGKKTPGFSGAYDSLLFVNAYRQPGFLVPEYALFDQKGSGMHMNRPNEVFISSFRGHVKGSSQVRIPPVKMLEAIGKLVSQNRDYSLTLDPYAETKRFRPFYTSGAVSYPRFLSLVQEGVLAGMKDALFSGTAAVLGRKLKNGSPYFYYAKTGTTGNEAADEKSKLFVIVISEKDITDPDFNFRENKFYTIYFTSQNGPPKQNEAFQADIIKWVEESAVFKKYMKDAGGSRNGKTYYTQSR